MPSKTKNRTTKRRPDYKNVEAERDAASRLITAGYLYMRLRSTQVGLDSGRLSQAFHDHMKRLGSDIYEKLVLVIGNFDRQVKQEFAGFARSRATPPHASSRKR